jgi:hypothetical protein
MEKQDRGSNFSTGLLLGALKNKEKTRKKGKGCY